MRKCAFVFFAALFIWSSPVAQTSKGGDDAVANETADGDEDVFSENVTGPTSIDFRPLTFDSDSLRNWRNKKEYNWLKNIDSVLKKNEDGQIATDDGTIGFADGKEKASDSI